MTALRCPVCRGEEGSIRFITSEIKVHYPTSEGAFPLIIPGTAGWIGGTDEPTARIDIAGGCGHNWSVLIRQSDLRVRYRVYQEAQNPEGPFMPRQPNGGQPAVNRDEGLTPAPAKRAGRSEASKEAARERMQALWAQARAEGRERPGGQIRRQPPAASDEGTEEEEKL